MTARPRSTAVFFPLLLLLIAGSPARAQFESQGTRVASIEFEADTTFDTSKLGELVSVKVGEPLSIRDVQGSIRALYGTGEFRDIQVDATSIGGEVALRFILSLSYRVAEIEFVGINTERLRVSKEIPFRRDDVLSLDAVDKGAAAIQTYLSRRGYLSATVDTEVAYQRDLNRAGVVFHIQLGPEASIAAVEFEGSTAPFEEGALIGAMSRAPGKTYRAVEARRDADRIRGFLVKRGHRRAAVRYLGETYDKASQSVRLRYRVDVGPQVRVEVTGVPRKAVRRMIPFRRKSEAYSEDAIDQSVDRITRDYQKRGYFFVAVDTKEGLQDGVWVVTFEVDPGKKYKLDRVVFEGNQDLSDRKLGKAVQTSRAGGVRRILAGLFRRGTEPTQEQLNDDRDALEALYRVEGFTQASIGRPLARPRNGTLDVVFPIVEGPRTIVTDARTEGSEQVKPGKLPNLTLEEGDPLNPQLLSADIINLKTFYGDRGNVEVQVSPKIDFTSDRRGAVVTYRIAEGPKVSVDDVIVRGNSYTESDVVLRRAHLNKGDPFSYRGLLSAQRDLYRLGIFQRIDLIPEQSGTALAERDVVIQVEEGKNLTVSGAVGYSTDESARGTVSVSHRNLFGTARYLGLEARVSEKQDRYVLSYREPFPFGLDVPARLTIFRGTDRTRDPFEILRIGTYLEASKVVREVTQWSLRYEYRRVDVSCFSQQCPSDVSGIPIPELPREDQSIEISSLTPTFFWDRRDDPFDPRRGFFASASIEYAFPLFAAKTEFLKGFSQGAWYRPTSARSGIAVSVRIGLIDPLSSPPGLGDGNTALIPFSERFTGGGETSHRAFELETLGIEGTFKTGEGGSLVVDEIGTIACLGNVKVGENEEERRILPCDDPAVNKIIAVGGNALAIVNLEYRFPIFGSLAGGVFVDGGNVWREIGDVDTGQFRWGVGAGLRYRTPLGPIRFDIGWKLDAEQWEEPYAAFLSLGYAF